jgi:hypothetical protein
LPTLSSEPRTRSAKGGCPIRWPTAWLSACSCAALLAGCGGEEQAREPAPRLPQALAEGLAAEADAVAARLDAGDPCGAAALAAALQQRPIEALNRPGAVPDALKDDLGSGVADVVDRAQSDCASATPPPAPPPPPPATTVNEDDEEGEDGGKRGKGRGKGKGRRKKDD